MVRSLLRALGVVLAALALFAVLLTVRALRLPSRQVAVAPAPARAVDVDGAARRLAESIRFETLSHEAGTMSSPEAFGAFHGWLAETYPRLHAALARETVSDWTLVYTWQGSDPALAPIVLLAHQDVVPAGDLDRWTHPPFAGVVADGFVWGRGAIDDKGSLVAICEAVEALLAEGFAPRRSVILVFGHDEEVGGPLGAEKAAEALAARGVRAELVIDEGLAVVSGVVPGVARPVALIGIAEKGSTTLEVVARAAGGHSSTPPKTTAAGILAAAIARLEANPLPAGIGDVTGRLFEYLAPELPLLARVPLANAALLLTPLDALLSGQPALNALLRTTTAVTMLDGSPKENVLPSEAVATVNFRILPGDTADEVLARVREIVTDPRVEVRQRGSSTHRNPSGVSPVDGEAFRLLQTTIGEVFPEAAVAPGLVLGGTDSRHFERVTDAVYRFGPFRFVADDLKRPHGIDERLGLENLAGGIRFYARLVENASR